MRLRSDTSVYHCHLPVFRLSLVLTYNHLLLIKFLKTKNISIFGDASSIFCTHIFRLLIASAVRTVEVAIASSDPLLLALALISCSILARSGLCTTLRIQAKTISCTKFQLCPLCREKTCNLYWLVDWLEFEFSRKVGFTHIWYKTLHSTVSNLSPSTYNLQSIIFEGFPCGLNIDFVSVLLWKKLCTYLSMLFMIFSFK